MSFLRRLFGRSDTEHHHSDDPVPGWDAINAALAPIYGDEEPLHWGTMVRWRMGGPDPLDGISAYRVDGPPAHWHYVTYGLSELYEKESDDAAVSGWGIELTFRLRRDTEETLAPMWAVSLLQNLARYVFESGNVLSPGDHLDLNGPIALEEATDIRAVMFVEDEQLKTIETPHGSVTFVQLVGLTSDEYEAVQDWDTLGFAELLRTHTPLLVTDLARQSILSDRETAAVFLERSANEGSSMGQLNLDDLEWSSSGDHLTITVGATAVPRLHRMLRGRLPFGNAMLLQGATASVAIQPGAALEWHDAGDGAVHVDLPTEVADRIVEIVRPVAATYPVATDLAIVVRRSIITDQAGNEVEIIG